MRKTTNGKILVEPSASERKLQWQDHLACIQDERWMEELERPDAGCSGDGDVVPGVWVGMEKGGFGDAKGQPLWLGYLT